MLEFSLLIGVDFPHQHAPTRCDADGLVWDSCNTIVTLLQVITFPERGAAFGASVVGSQFPPTAGQGDITAPSCRGGASPLRR